MLADPFPAPRRGRPPGSKNKAKQADAASPIEVPAAPVAFGIAAHVAEVEQEITPDRRSGEELRDEDVSIAPALPEPVLAPTEAPRATRLRDRSRILRRYVLGHRAARRRATIFSKQEGSSLESSKRER